MAQYKVPQDVEADDKLLGPFSFRQFVYLLIAGAMIALAVALFQLFPLLALIPLPIILLFAALALPLKKDQPMETYLAAVASYYLKPHNRVWIPGQRESTVQITAPKIVEESRTREITGEEATHRLSFLADIVDTGGYAIKGMGVDHVNAELAEEAVQTYDMFESDNFNNLQSTIVRDENKRHAEVVQGMREEIAKNENLAVSGGIVKRGQEEQKGVDGVLTSDVSNTEIASLHKPNYESPVVVRPEKPKGVLTEKSDDGEPSIGKPVEKSDEDKTKQANPGIMELVNNPDFSVATIAKQANRIKAREEGEVFISLH